MAARHRPLLLAILDGWGYRESQAHNPILNASTPFIDSLFLSYPHTLLSASGTAVGLPQGQIGNSEVGHHHIGAGRRIPQDLLRINEAIERGDFFSSNSVFLQAADTAIRNDCAIHVLGLLSPGGVHSHERHIHALLEWLSQVGVRRSYCHAFLDGRDTLPQSALPALTLLKDKIVSVVGRYYAMDRDRRWDRVQVAYDLLTRGVADYRAPTAEAALKMAYARGETDEFVRPTLIAADGESARCIQSGDIVIFMHFRADRARQLTQALTDEQFNAFQRSHFPKLHHCITLTKYSDRIKAKVACPERPLSNTLGEYLAKNGLSQLRIAETEKYAHVTYFINGGRETPFEREDRILVASPQVATYDQQPEMSAWEVTEHLVNAIRSKRYDFIVCNYANPDMLGHTGIHAAAEKAVVTMDACLQRVITVLRAVGGEAIITADHGNVETMYDEALAQPHTAHTANPVPFIYVGRAARYSGIQGSLQDIAPTVLSLLGLLQPPEMTGRSLICLEAP